MIKIILQGSKISLEVKNKAQKGGYMAENVLKIEYVPIDSINPYPNNAKLHPAEQIEQIKKSIEEFGMNDPIGVWNNEVVEGHGRLIALMELGYEEVPIIRLDDLSDEKRRAYMLVHNKLTMNSDYDLTILQEELEDIINISMDEYGFDIGAIEIDDIDNEILNPKEPIAKELGEANNYVVLEFFTEEEWIRAQQIFGLEKVQTADKNENIRRHGIGRVISGVEVLDALEGAGDED